jgi:hypothetical protein
VLLSKATQLEKQLVTTIMALKGKLQVTGQLVIRKKQKDMHT